MIGHCGRLDGNEIIDCETQNVTRNASAGSSLSQIWDCFVTEVFLFGKDG